MAAPSNAAIPEVTSDTLSDADILAFARAGCLIARGVVPEPQWRAALTTADHMYAMGMHTYKPDPPVGRVPVFPEELGKHDVVRALMRDTPLFRIVEQLVGRGVPWQPQAGQVAYREPNHDLRKQGWHEHSAPNPDGWHVDGSPGEFSHMASGFTMLVGVCLSDQTAQRNHGQLLVWPGSHAVLHERLKPLVRDRLITRPYSVFASGVEGHPRPRIGDPVRVRLRPGDAVLAHQRLGHVGGPNLGTEIRKTIYLRIINRHHKKYLLSEQIVYGSVWTEYDGVREVLQKYGMPQ